MIQSDQIVRGCDAETARWKKLLMNGSTTRTRASCSPQGTGRHDVQDVCPVYYLYVPTSCSALRLETLPLSTTATRVPRATDFDDGDLNPTVLPTTPPCQRRVKRRIPSLQPAACSLQPSALPPPSDLLCLSRVCPPACCVTCNWCCCWKNPLRPLQPPASSLQPSANVPPCCCPALLLAPPCRPNEHAWRPASPATVAMHRPRPRPLPP